MGTVNNAFLIRGPSTDQGTFGILFANGASVCRMLELPDRNNKQQISRIPEGLYRCSWIISPRFGACYQIERVPGRGNILIHPGNFAGDTELGFKTHSHGCILPCVRFGAIAGQRAGLISKPAVNAIVALFDKQPFMLEVKDA